MSERIEVEALDEDELKAEMEEKALKKSEIMYKWYIALDKRLKVRIAALRELDRLYDADREKFLASQPYESGDMLRLGMERTILHYMREQMFAAWKDAGGGVVNNEKK